MPDQINLLVDPALPIHACGSEIAGLIASHQVVVVAGETGSGKSTQLPKICLALGRKSIAHTQPRRIAARSVATRVAAETGTDLGQVVGYQIRFTAATSASTRLTVMTDGILLAQIAHDRLLRRYDTIIVDEAHERSLNIDFILGYLKQLLPKRPDLKVIITSATIDTARFSEHFGGAPVVEVSGRAYPVEIRYAPLADDDDPVQAMVAAVKSLPRHGDVLVFCSGEREIRDGAKAIAGAGLGVEVVPLFARLTMEEQARVFAPHPGRRVVLATNVAETSLTVPGIRYVVDPGFARISRYSARTKVQRLPIEPVSQASANQRAGRCGRVAPGVCVRLYSQEDFDARPAYTEPEILRTSLASVILAMINAELGDIASFPFVEPPDRSHIGDGLRLLAELGAITQAGDTVRLTKTGRQLAALPIDPRLGRMLLEAAKQDCLKEVMVIVAGLSIQDVRERPAAHRDQANQLHARFRDTPPAPGGDITAWLRLWDYLKAKRKELSSNQFRRLCRAEFLNYLRVREWQDLVGQLRDIARDLKLRVNSSPAPTTDILTACLAGLLSNIGALEAANEKGGRGGGKAGRGGRPGPREYAGTRGARFAISPGSHLAKVHPELVMAVELVETTRLWAHGVAAITPAQVEAVGAHMLTRTCSEPFFSTTSGSVLAHEKTSLLGVPLVADRRVDYAAIDPAAARAVFIQTGLVEAAANPRPGTPYARVATHNRAVRRELEAMEDKVRRRGLLADDFQIAAFFDDRLPGNVCSLASLDRWLRADKVHEKLLMMTTDDLVGRGYGVSEADYPTTWTSGEIELGLDYRFAPGDARDGVTVEVPLAALASLDPAPFTWAVPGSRQDLAAGLIRTLPKAVRTKFVPAPDWAKRALDWLEEHGADPSRPFAAELARALTGLSGEAVTGFDELKLPDHLRLGFLVPAPGGAKFSRDLASLQADLGQQVRQKLATASPRKRLAGTTWVFGSIPGSVTVREHGLAVTGYPALRDETDNVREVLLTSEAEARRSHQRGLARLVCFALPEPYKWLTAHLTNADKLALGTSPYGSVPALMADARLAAVTDLAGREDLWRVRDEAGFEAVVDRVRPDQVDATHRLVVAAAGALRGFAEVEGLLSRVPDGDLKDDVRQQVDNLVFDGFLRVIGAKWLPRVPVWLKAAAIRLQTAPADPRRDALRMQELDPVLDAYAGLLEAYPDADDETDRIGCLIEEFRVQLFAQSLRTAETVSAKRIMAAIAARG